MGLYYRLSRQLSDNRMLPVEENPYHHATPDVDWYTSLYYYNDSHFETWKKTRSFAGMDGVVTNRIFFDFDSEDLESTRKDALEVISRLIAFSIDPKNVQVCFSGQKGFSVSVKIDKFLNPDQLKVLTSKIAEGIETYDPIVYDNQRIIRLPGTKHQKSGLYKLPLETEELENLSIDEIKSLASNYDEIDSRLQNFKWDAVHATDNLLALSAVDQTKKATVKPKKINMELTDLNLKDKPRWMPSCKYAIQEGFFENGHRRESLMILAATYKAQGFSLDHIYRMLKASAQKQEEITGEERFPDDETYRVAEQVTSDKWKGGQYTCKTHPILMGICQNLGPNACVHNAEGEQEVYHAKDVSKLFKHYAKHIDSNTIKTGVPVIDENIRMTIGMHVGILASPGAGKTSLLLEILENTSKQGITSFFFSMDMYGPLIYQKQIQRLTGMRDFEIFKLILSADGGDQKAIRKLNEIDEKISESYANVKFHFKSGLTVEQMRDIVLNYQKETGDVVKLISIDYAECISGPYSDAFNNSKIIAHKLKDLASQDNFCVLTLVQPPKSAGDASEPLYSMRQVKGPSDWEQGFSIVLGVYREGYSPKNPETDKFLTITALKNRMGGLFSADCLWDGPTGKISPLDEGTEDWYQLQDIRERKSASKANSGWN